MNGTTPTLAGLTLIICYLPKERLRAQLSCKKEGRRGMSLMLFWGVGFVAFGWLVFKIAERM